MARQSRTFRIFVSSTFSDLKEERNALQKHVFPKLRELCMQHGCRFQAIDLRWGIREEATLDQQTMKICLEEIARCQKVTPRPNFIVLLGDRYGWRPLPWELPADEFDEILKHVSDEEKALLEKWYWRDDNAVPPVYDLQPRTGEYVEWDNWEALERRIRSILLRAIADMELSQEARSKYIASATEQEIMRGALTVKDASEHVFCFFRQLSNLPKDQRAQDFIDVDENGKADKEAKVLLADLKKRLKKTVPKNVSTYKVTWQDLGSSAPYLERLCDDVLQGLTRVIESEIAQLEEIDPLEQEIADHEAFGKKRSRFFTGRAEILQTIAEYIEGKDPHPLVIWGESGSGKTSLMVKAVEQARDRHPNWTIIVRYIGVTPGSCDNTSLLESLCQEIWNKFNFAEMRQLVAEIIGLSGETQWGHKLEEQLSIPKEYQKFSSTFRNFLLKISEEKTLVLVLDALDQLSLSGHTRYLDWLPSKLPQNIRLIVSILQGESLSILDQRLPKKNLVPVDRMPINEGTRLLDIWLTNEERRLQDNQKAEVLEKFEACGLPLYLELIFEEARKWTSYSKITRLGSDVPDMMRHLFASLSSNANHGEILFSRAIGYFAVAKNGLTEDEIIDVLSTDEDVFQDFMRRSFHELPEKRLPAVVWSRLYFDLEPYLTERAADGTSLLAFYHRQFEEIVSEDFLAGKTKHAMHKALAEYFGAQALQFETDGKRSPNVRKVSELPYQQALGELWDGLEQTLCDLLFIEAKCAAGMIHDLMADYNLAMATLPKGQENRREELDHQARVQKYTCDLIAYARGKINELEIIHSIRPWTQEEINRQSHRIINDPSLLDHIQAFSHFVASDGHALMKCTTLPGFCLQRAYNHSSSGPVALAAEGIISLEKERVVLMKSRRSRTSFSPFPLELRILEGHADCITAVRMTPDGRLAISGSRDGVIRLWNLDSGICLRVFQEHAGPISTVDITPDGSVAISASEDSTIRSWDIRTGECIRRIAIDESSFGLGALCRIRLIRLIREGRQAISIGLLGDQIMVWDLEAGNCTRKFGGKGRHLGALSVTADGRVAISGGEDYIRVWDVETGACIKTIGDQSGDVIALDMTPNGLAAISGHSRHMINMWDVQSGGCVKTFGTGPLAWPKALSVTPDAKLAVSASTTDCHVWDLSNGEPVRILEGHFGVVTSVCISHDGKFVVSGSEDNTVRLWGIENGTSRKTPEGHWTGFRVNAMCKTPDGSVVISAGHDDRVLSWDTITGEFLQAFEGRYDGVNCVTVSPCGQSIICGNGDGDIWVLDRISGKPSKRIRAHNKEEGRTALSFTPDGARAVSASFGRRQILRMLDLQTGACIKTRKGDMKAINTLTTTADGRLAISGDTDGGRRLWDLRTLQCLGTSESLRPLWDKAVLSFALTPDGKIFVSGKPEEKDNLYVFDFYTGICLNTLEGHKRAAVAASITPNGRLAISGSDDTTVRLWDLRTGICLKKLEGHTDRVYYTSSLSADGLHILSISNDTTLRIWDLVRGECVALEQARAPITTAIFSEAEGYLVCGTSEGEVINFFAANLERGPLTVTATRIWLCSTPNSHWDDQVTAFCLWCANRFPITKKILALIGALNRDARITPDQSPCLELPDEAWDEPGLLSECPLCHKPLKFNPFIVDNRDRY
jgi:WD40 repeat protein